MTIADNLEALAQQKLSYQDSVEACKTSLANKDVEVPVDAKLADISGLIDDITVDKSWENYVAVRNRTKTTIEAGDIDVSKITGVASAYDMFGNTSLTSVSLEFTLIAGANCLAQCFYNCVKLTTVRLGLPNLSGAGTGNIFLSCPNINNLTITGMSNQTIWGNTNIFLNLFAQTPLSSCQNLTITVPILPNLYLAVMTSLNLASVIQVLGQLYDYSSGVAHTITFNRSFTGLSLEDYNLINNAKIEANSRNWTVAGLTYSM